MTAPARRPRRRSGNGTESPTLARLAAAREQLDAEIVERRRREDGLLTEYAAATDAVTEAEARRDAALAELERQAAQVRETAEQELATLEARQGAVLVALHGDRTAEELAHLVALPLRRVRTLLRSHREPEGATEASPATAAPATPASAPPPQPGAATGDSRSGGDGPAGPETTAGPDAEPDAGPPPGDRRRPGHGVAPTGGGPALPVRAERIGAAWRRALPVLHTGDRRGRRGDTVSGRAVARGDAARCPLRGRRRSAPGRRPVRATPRRRRR